MPLEDELAESNRRIAELSARLEEERRRTSQFETQLSNPNAMGWKEAAKGETPLGGLGPEASKIFDAKMFMHPAPQMLKGQDLYMSLPSVVTWFTPATLQKVASEFHPYSQVEIEHPGASSNISDLGLREEPEIEVEAESIRELTEHDSHVWCCALHPLVPLVATGSGDKTLRLWRLDGECLRVLRGHKEWVYCCGFDAMGNLLCSGSFDGTIRIWNVASGQCVKVIYRPNVGFHAVAFQPGAGAYIAAGTSEKVVRIFRVADGEVARSLGGHTKAVTCLAFSPPDGRLLATGSVDGSLRIWVVETGTCRLKLAEEHKAKIWCCAFNSTSDLVASGGSDNVVRVWRIADGAEIAVLKGHKGAVRAVAFNPVLRGMIASAEGNLTWGSDNSARLWLIGNGHGSDLDVPDGQTAPSSCKAILLGHKNMVTCLAFPPDGSLLVTGSRDYSVRFWAISLGKQDAVAAKRRFGVGSAIQSRPQHGSAPSGTQPLGSGTELREFSSSQDQEHEDTAEVDRTASEEPQDQRPLPAQPAISDRIKVVTSKAAKSVNKKLTKPLVSGLSALWKGSLFSEGEIEKIKREKEHRKTDSEKAHDLYWSMYKSKIDEAAASAFVEAAAAVEDDDDDDDEKRKKKGGPSPDEIAKELKALTENLSAPQPSASTDAQENLHGELATEEKSDDLLELEQKLERQKAGRKEFEEKLEAEKEAMERVRKEVEEKDVGGMGAEEVRELVKAATYSGYRLAELKRHKDEELGEGALAELREQRAKFEKYVASQRAELKAQADKVQDLFEQLRQKSNWDTQSSWLNTPNSAPQAAPGEEPPATWSSFYRKPAPDHFTVLSSAEGRALLKDSGEQGEQTTLQALEVYRPTVSLQSELGALALALNSLHLDSGRLWSGPWRWFSVALLRTVLPANWEQRHLRPEELSALGAACGAEAEGYEASHADLDLFRSQLKNSVAAPSMEQSGCVIVGFSKEALGLEAAQITWGCVTAFHSEMDMCLLIETNHAPNQPVWTSCTDLWKAICHTVVRKAGKKATTLSTGFVVLRRNDDNSGLFSRFCARGLDGKLPPIQDIVMTIESIAPAALENCRDPGTAVSALVGSAMSKGMLVHILRQYELVIAQSGYLEAAHADLIAQMMNSIRSSKMYVRIELILQDEMVRIGVGSWKASRASAELLTFLIAACDPAVLFGKMTANLRTEMEGLHSSVLATSPDITREARVVRAHVSLIQLLTQTQDHED